MWGGPNMVVDCAQFSPQFTITTTDATPLGSVTLTLRASSGSLAHEATLTLVTVPVVQTSQQGTMLTSKAAPTAIRRESGWTPLGAVRSSK